MKPFRRLFETSLCIALFTSLTVSASEYLPVGPEDSAAFEKGLWEILGVYVEGIWPAPQVMKDALPTDKLPKEHLQELETWLNRVLQPQLKPATLNAVEWKGLRGLRHRMNYIIGTWQAAGLEARIEVQANEDTMSITVTSNKLLNKKAIDLSADDVRAFAAKILAIPAGKLEKIQVEKRIREIAGTSVCYGVLRCEWDEKKDDDATRRWWSYIPLWYTDGKLFVSVSTVDWEHWRPRASPKYGSERWKF